MDVYLDRLQASGGLKGGNCSLKSLIFPAILECSAVHFQHTSHGGSRRFESCCAHHISITYGVYHENVCGILWQIRDPARLPPIGEVESKTFSTTNRSHLTTIVRQAAGNPILEAAGIIRCSQGGRSDWSWLRQSALASGHGVFLPGEAAHRWMRKAFTSEEFEATLVLSDISPGPTDASIRSTRRFAAGATATTYLRRSCLVKALYSAPQSS